MFDFLGRYPTNDIKIENDLFISKQQHSLIRFEKKNNSLYICDEIKKGNGIWKKIKNENLIQNNDIIKISEFEY